MSRAFFIGIIHPPIPRFAPPNATIFSPEALCTMYNTSFLELSRPSRRDYLDPVPRIDSNCNNLMRQRFICNRQYHHGRGHCCRRLLGIWVPNSEINAIASEVVML